MKQENELFTIRHSCEHVLMQAMENLGYKILKAMGPATDDGFYFDFDLLDGRITEEDFPKIEAEMLRIKSQNLPISRISLTPPISLQLFKDNPYKLEWVAEAIKRNDPITAYWTGEPNKKGSFVDLCAGPHVTNTSEIGFFKLLSVAGAYWRGSEKNKMLTRVYGTAFPTQKELDDYLALQEEIKKRDHRKLGRDLELFTFSEEIGPGLPLWLPAGTTIKDELEKWGKETEEKWGYQRVSTPFLTKRKLFEISGHVPYFEEEMYKVHVPRDEKDEYFIRPMNCPFHHMIFKSQLRSYKELPLRLAEYGHVARYEDAGSLNGILRPRFFCQNDAHIYSTEDQAVDEFVSVVNLHRYYYDTLGLKNYHIVLCLRDPKKKGKYHGNETMWQKAEKLSREALEKSKIEYAVENEGAAHYGPKMDFKIKSAIGAEYGISTNQIDLFMPKRFNLTYIDKDGKEKLVVVQHRAPLGSSERFVGFLIEHFSGNFPLWLSPTQVQIIPISNQLDKYVQKILNYLIDQNIRTRANLESDTMQNKIRKAQELKIPVMVIIGNKEKDQEKISVRYRDGKQENLIELEAFTKTLKDRIIAKSLDIY
ncbi:threonine--tRNA ligase [candidate division WWE3 bacterium CG08_land_8_20_14_0_20_40_13]|uniref:Threonine--tRNA ligase n=1 Tax=candidate division WWE3 bacterium CG08_land_8_20_14_0_20_40_13 TaxID=1975084 RepID=A0A2H0XEB8_UNCKA|nr:MAG: threonine--tRNA ligase [candidate division WWE3 bacterium CG08_land_8_20_14_0_20_40_13]